MCHFNPVKTKKKKNVKTQIGKVPVHVFLALTRKVVEFLNMAVYLLCNLTVPICRYHCHPQSCVPNLLRLGSI